MAAYPVPEDKLHAMAAQAPNSVYPSGYPSYPTTQPDLPPGPSSLPPAYNPQGVQQPQQPQTVYTINGDPSCCVPPAETGGDSPKQEGQLEDYYVMMPPIQIDYNGVFQEPKDASGCQALTTYNGYIYNWTKRGLYILFTALLGPIMAFAFGLLFAVMEFAFVWVMNPSVRVLHMLTRFCSMLYRPIARMILDPVFESFGQQYRVRNSGLFTERKYKVDVSGITLPGAQTSQHQHTA